MEKNNNRTQFISFCCEMVEKYGLGEEIEMRNEDYSTITEQKDADTSSTEEYLVFEQEKVGGGY